jgi:hypothetical protein
MMEAEDLIAKVENRKKADALLDEAEKLFVSGVFEEAAGRAREANAIYVKLNNSLGIRKSDSVVALSEEKLKTTTVSKTTIPMTTITSTTTVSFRREDWEGRNYVILGSLALIAFTAYHVIKTTVRLRKKKAI